MGADDATSKDLLGLFIKDPKGESVSDVVGNAKPTTGAFLSVGPRLFMVQEQKGLPEGELEEGRYIRGGTLHVLEWCHGVRQRRVSTDVMDISDILGCMEPQGFRGSCPVKELVDLVLDISYGVSFDRVLLGMVWFCELVLDQEFTVDGSHLRALFLTSIVTTEGRGSSPVPDEFLVVAGKFTF